LQEHVKIGDLIIVTGALRGEGTSRYYVAQNFSTVAHPEIVEALKRAAESLRVRFHVGWIFTTDALFQETPELIAQLTQQNISGIDMVTSAFLTIAQIRKKRRLPFLPCRMNVYSASSDFVTLCFSKPKRKSSRLPAKLSDIFSAITSADLL
jgi:uridine phosphorylase